MIITFNPRLQTGLVHPYQSDKSISGFRDVWCIFSFLFYFEWIFLLANSEDPDQKAVSDLGLYYLPMSQKWNARLKLVKHKCCFVLSMDFHFCHSQWAWHFKVITITHDKDVPELRKEIFKPYHVGLCCLHSLIRASLARTQWSLYGGYKRTP